MAGIISSSANDRISALHWKTPLPFACLAVFQAAFCILSRSRCCEAGKRAPMSLCAVQDWGLEFNMALLLIAAFYSTNLFSLVYLAIIAVGMAAPVSARCLTWRFCVLPLLAVVVVEQYSLYIGPPPPWDQSQSEALGRHHDDTPQSSIRVSS